MVRFRLGRYAPNDPGALAAEVRGGGGGRHIVDGNGPLAADAAAAPAKGGASFGRGVAIGLAVWLLTTVLGVLWLRGQDPGGASVDFVAFWTGARALADGKNPYDPQVLRSYVPETGYQKILERHTGPQGHMPFYYPIWFLYLIAPLVPLGFALARCVWTTWLLQGYVATILLAVYRARGGAVLPGLTAAMSASWIYVFIFGQPVALLLPTMLACLCLWDARRDAAAGACAALLLVKPHLGLLPTAAMFILTLRQGRTRAAAALVGVPAALGLLAMLWFPAWPWEFLAAPTKNPWPSGQVGGVNVTLWEYLRFCLGNEGTGRTFALGVQGTVAALLAAGLFQLAWDRRTSLERLFAAAVLATFFVFPYVRFYDVPLLLVAALHLANRRPGSWTAKGFLLVWWLGMWLDEWLKMEYWSTGGLLTLQMEDGWLALFTAVWWLWDAFVPAPEGAAAGSAAKKHAADRPPGTALAGSGHGPN